MPTLTIRNVDEALKTNLRIQAARHGQSMEEEVRFILRRELMPTQQSGGLGSRLVSRFRDVAGELPLPERSFMMRTVQVVEAKAKFSTLLAEVEAGETVAITRHGRVVERLVPDQPRMAADVFRTFWDHADEIDFEAPQDPPPDAEATL